MTDFLDLGQEMKIVLLTAPPPEDTARGVTVPEEEQESDLDFSPALKTNSLYFLSLYFIHRAFIQLLLLKILSYF